ncbi:hypothetical protein [Coxiella-like endosymbiont]|nr:hypothetical protein [Coxiella-like endosymbiont]
MKRTVGALLFTDVGGMVGSGWLFGPYFVARLSGSSAILEWVIGGPV